MISFPGRSLVEEFGGRTTHFYFLFLSFFSLVLLSFRWLGRANQWARFFFLFFLNFIIIIFFWDGGKLKIAARPHSLNTAPTGSRTLLLMFQVERKLKTKKEDTKKERHYFSFGPSETQ